MLASQESGMLPMAGSTPPSSIPHPSATFREFISSNLVQPAYIRDLKLNLGARLFWRKTGRIFFWISNFCILLSGIFNFLQLGFRINFYWSIAAGISNICTFMFLNFAIKSKEEESAITRDLNEVLKTIGVQPFPEQNNEVFKTEQKVV